jgi:hypothetical protein
MHHRSMPSAVKDQYQVQVDASQRVKIHAEKNACFHAFHLDDGSIVFLPSEAIVAKAAKAAAVAPKPPGISAKTLRGMDAAIANLRAGKRSKPVDLKRFAALNL